jgi:hypothetical protein
MVRRRGSAFSPIPYVSGFQAGLTASKRLDPLVVFLGASYFSDAAQRPTSAITLAQDPVRPGMRAARNHTNSVTVRIAGGLNRRRSLSVASAPGASDPAGALRLPGRLLAAGHRGCAQLNALALPQPLELLERQVHG